LSTLEDRYRRLLAWYPAGHRSSHEQEMLDVLMDGARPGQSRPTLAESADLIVGAARIRLRRAVGEPEVLGWPAALAMAGFLAMMLLVADGLRFVLNVPSPMWRQVQERAADGEDLPHLLALYFGTGPYWLGWTVIAVLAWSGLRRPATAMACAITGVQLVLSVYGTTFQFLPGSSLAASLAGVPLPLAILATACLLASPGPRHGARLLGRGRAAGVAGMAIVLIALHWFPLFSLAVGDYQQSERFLHAAENWNKAQMAALLATSILTTVVLARSHQGRRACALLAIAATPLIVRETGPLHDMGPSGGYPSLVFLMMSGLVGFAMTMLCVRVAERVFGDPGRGRRQTPA
jgi:hypothetical protein